MKIVSWNVNGLRACMGKGFMDFFVKADADIFCIQETKLQQGDAVFDFTNYHEFWNDADKKGYSGTAVLSRKEPLGVSYGMAGDGSDGEGRVITLKFEDFYLVNAYVPNSGEELKRLEFRMKWDDEFREYLLKLDSDKPVIACGDFNVAHQEIDLKNPSSNRRNAGFTDEEREKFSKLLDSGFCDSFRFLYPDVREVYTYWSYRFGSRARNAGWRIDYICLSDRLINSLNDFVTHGGVMGSDHCPIEANIQ